LSSIGALEGRRRRHGERGRPFGASQRGEKQIEGAVDLAPLDEFDQLPLQRLFDAENLAIADLLAEMLVFENAQVIEGRTGS
jgi:hypothetical protein